MHTESIQGMAGPKVPSQAECWYAAQTKHQHEKKVAQLLQNKGYEVFLPLVVEKRRWKDRVKQVPLPMFPCYLFLRITVDRKMDILKIPGLFQLVGMAGRACPISDSEIAAIRKVADARVKVESHPYLISGTFVRVRSGSLAGLTGKLTKVKNVDRVVVSLELLQKAVSVEVDRSNLEQISWEN